MDDLPDFPWRHVPLEHAGGPRMAGALELAAPLALGQRGLVVAPPRTGATTVLRWMGAAARAAVPGCEIMALLIDRPVEEFAEWREELPGCEVIGTSSDEGAADHAALAAPFEAAAERAAAGADVVLLVESLASLARALTATWPAPGEGDGPEQVHECGVPHAVVRELRRLFGLARAAAGGAEHADSGSLTVLATVRSGGEAGEVDELLLHELVSTGNVEWRLDSEAFRAGAFPPVDIMASGARRTELILGEDEAERRGRMRAKVDERGLVGGLGELLVQLDTFGSLAATMDDALAERWSPGGGQSRAQGGDEGFSLSDLLGGS